jgi:hypothetical protein
MKAALTHMLGQRQTVTKSSDGTVTKTEEDKKTTPPEKPKNSVPDYADQKLN